MYAWNGHSKYCTQIARLKFAFNQKQKNKKIFFQNTRPDNFFCAPVLPTNQFLLVQKGIRNIQLHYTNSPSKQTQIDDRKEAHSDWLTGNAGATQQATVVVVWETLLVRWCGTKLLQSMNKPLFFYLFHAVLLSVIAKVNIASKVYTYFLMKTSAFVFRGMHVWLTKLPVSHVQHFVRRYLCAGQ